MKSADSISEKMVRKQIIIQDAFEIPQRMSDILGFRIVVANKRELDAVDDFLSNHFEVVSRSDLRMMPGEFGQRGIQYCARYETKGTTFTFELQLRTFLQHYWASQSFHLFHKQPREVANGKKRELLQLAEFLDEAEKEVEKIAITPDEQLPSEADPQVELFCGRVHLIAIRPGEILTEHSIVPLSNFANNSNETVVEKKLAMYSLYPGAAIVECSCLNFAAFHFNEPLVRVPLNLLHSTGD